METDAALELAGKVAALRLAEETLIEANDDEVVAAAQAYSEAVGERNAAYDKANNSPINLGDRASGVVKEQPIGGQS